MGLFTCAFYYGPLDSGSVLQFTLLVLHDFLDLSQERVISDNCCCNNYNYLLGFQHEHG